MIYSFGQYFLLLYTATKEVIRKFFRNSFMKKTDYLKWDEYFMAIAMLSAQRSKDPSTGVGACIVGEDNRILSLGYNGMPIGCSDDDFPWDREGSPLDTKYLYG